MSLGAYLAVLAMHAAMVTAPAALAGMWPSSDGTIVPAAVRFAGGALIVLGAGLYAASHWFLARSGRGTPAAWQPPRFLVLGGPYRSMRNPMYAAVMLVAAGEAFCFGNALLAVYAAGLFAGLHLFVLWVEEPALVRSFGESYERYRRSVPRWLPRRFPPPDLIS